MNPPYPNRPSKTSRIFPQLFDLPGATALGGLNHLARFLRLRGLDDKLARRFRSVKASWARWRLDRVLRMHLDASFAGIARLYHFQDLETEPLLCAQHGVGRLPDLATMYRDLHRFASRPLLAALHELVRETTEEALVGQERVVLEVDSTVETLYGRQEGAEVGPNPHKRGRPSYHPLLARDRISDLVVNHRLRPGNTGSSTDAVSFLHQTLDIVGVRQREVLARLDAGFESEPVLRALEWRGVGYVIKMRGTLDLAARGAFLAPQAWRRVESAGVQETQVASFYWQRPSAWKGLRRVVVVRRRGGDELQGHLFDLAGWSYGFLVTDRDWAEEDVVRFYDKRADVERTICEAKHDLNIGHVPTDAFGANAADLALKILARNLLVLYRDVGLGLRTRERVMTLRRRYLWVPGRLVRRAGRTILRLTTVTPLGPAAAAHPLRC